MKNKLLKNLVASIALMLCGVANAGLITIGSVTDNGGGSYTISSNGVDDALIEALFGLSSGLIDGLAVTTDPDLATEGSGLGDNVNISTGEIFSFDWLWTSSEVSGTTTFNDFAFVVLNYENTTVLADTFTPDNTVGSFSWESDYTGVLSYGIFSVDVGDTLVDSFLTVSNLSHTSIPEPSMLAVFALMMMALVSRNVKIRFR